MLDPPELPALPVALSPGTTDPAGVGIAVGLDRAVGVPDGAPSTTGGVGPTATRSAVNFMEANAPMPATSTATIEMAAITAALRVSRRRAGLEWRFSSIMTPADRTLVAVLQIRVSLNLITSEFMTRGALQ